MLDCYYIRKIFDLPEYFVITECEESEGIITIHITLERTAHHCPHCNVLTDKVHDYRKQRIQHAVVNNRPVYLLFKRRRYVCPNCGKRFYEDNHEVIRYQRHTSSFHMMIFDKLADRISVKNAAKQLSSSVSAVYRAMRQISYPQPSSFPVIIVIDEFGGNIGEKFQCLLTDPVDNTILDVLPSRKPEELYAYFNRIPIKERMKVKYIVMDLSPLFRSVMTAAFPKAEIIADKFHVKRLFLWALESVRKDVQKKFSKTRRIYFKHSRTLLLKDYKNLTDEQKQQLINMLDVAPDLKIAYGLKELFNQFLESETIQELAANYKKLVMDIEQANIPVFTKCLKTINQWYHAIYLSITTGISNGYTEGQNNNIKVLKRISYGCRNFTYFRNRIMHIANNTPDKCQKRRTARQAIS